MVKTTLAVVLGLMLVLTLGFASATPSTTTIIAGKIYNADYTAVIQGADVTVNCAGNVLLATSGDDGSYKVQYTDLCKDGDTLTVSATFGSLSGSKTGKVKATCSAADKDNNCLIPVFAGVDVAIVNVPLVPEFGTAIGILTALGALGVFFVVRKK